MHKMTGFFQSYKELTKGGDFTLIRLKPMKNPIKNRVKDWTLLQPLTTLINLMTIDILQIVT